VLNAQKNTRTFELVETVRESVARRQKLVTFHLFQLETVFSAPTLGRLASESRSWTSEGKISEELIILVRDRLIGKHVIAGIGGSLFLDVDVFLVQHVRLHRGRRLVG
jgi:hypothetical protein